MLWLVLLLFSMIMVLILLVVMCIVIVVVLVECLMKGLLSIWICMLVFRFRLIRVCL